MNLIVRLRLSSAIATLLLAILSPLTALAAKPTSKEALGLKPVQKEVGLGREEEQVKTA